MLPKKKSAPNTAKVSSKIALNRVKSVETDNGGGSNESKQNKTSNKEPVAEGLQSKTANKGGKRKPKTHQKAIAENSKLVTTRAVLHDGADTEMEVTRHTNNERSSEDEAVPSESDNSSEEGAEDPENSQGEEKGDHVSLMPSSDDELGSERSISGGDGMQSDDGDHSMDSPHHEKRRN